MKVGRKMRVDEEPKDNNVGSVPRMMCRVVETYIRPTKLGIGREDLLFSRSRIIPSSKRLFFLLFVSVEQQAYQALGE